MKKILDELRWRGLIHQTTDDNIEKKLLNQNFSVYTGFDPTSNSLHIGNLLPIICMKHFENFGYNPLYIIGTYTGFIGDPSGKNKERELLDISVIKQNACYISNQICKITKTYNKNLYNQWLESLDLIGFLRDIGKEFSVNIMLGKDSVKNRLNDGISYTEFTYMLLQAYDFLYLYKNENCKIQIGGSDQWGNIISGIDLIRRKTKEESFGITLPLILNSNGTKFGKSESGTIWLDEDKTSIFNFYQFWINVGDNEVIQYLKYFTFLDKDIIDNIELSHKINPEKRIAQTILADNVTDFVHGSVKTQEIKNLVSYLFSNDVKNNNPITLKPILKDLPNILLPKEYIKTLSIIDILNETKLFDSKNKIKNLIINGGLYINGDKITTPKQFIHESQIFENSLILRKGKKESFVLIFK